jgi:hypothetical protein
MFYCEFSLFIAQQKIDLNNTLTRIYKLNLRNYKYIKQRLHAHLKNEFVDKPILCYLVLFFMREFKIKIKTNESRINNNIYIYLKNQYYLNE